MPGYFSYDLETSIQYEAVQVPCKGKHKGKLRTVRKDSLHGPSWKDPRNDFYTIIYANKPTEVKLLHSKKGFKRKLPYRVGQNLLKCHTIIGTNLKFDLGYIWNDKYFQQFLLDGGKIWDCQVAQYLLSGQRHQFPSLAEMQKVHLKHKTKQDRISRLYKHNIGANEIIMRANYNQTTYRINFKVVLIAGILVFTFNVHKRSKPPLKRLWLIYEMYATEDGKTPMLIMQKQYKQAKEEGMLPIIELYNQYLLALTMMEINGIPVDIPAVEKLYREFSLKVVEYLEEATKLVKHLWQDDRLPVLNINSTQHSSLLLFGGEMEVKVKRGTGVLIKSGPNKDKEKSKKVIEKVQIKGMQLPLNLTKPAKREGYYSTDKGVIENVYAKSTNTLAKDYCKLLKLSGTYKQKISTYLSAMLYRSVNRVISANYNNTETATSRLSASKPNLQNIPAHGEFGASIPALLIAPKGWTCASIDFSQLEVLCQAMLSEDLKLVNDIQSGLDFHVKRLCYIEPNYTYEEISKLSKVDKVGDWPEKRSKAKVISFQKAYGAAPESLARITELDIKLVKEIFEKEDLEYPNVKLFDEKVANEIKNSAIVSYNWHYAAKHGKDSKDSKGVPRKFIKGVELLPIRNRDKTSYYFDYDEVRHVGFYRSPTGKKYAFPEYGSLTKNGDVFKYYKPTQMKNYAMQGTAGDIQAITTVAMFQILLRHPDKVKLVNEIHDSKWFLIKNEYLSVILNKICAIMKSTSSLLNKRFGIEVPFDFDVEAKVGKDFANMEVFKLGETNDSSV